MERDHPALLAVVRAVCDGARIDWHAAESELSDSVRGTLSELRALADLAGVNRSLGGETREIQNRPGLDPPSPLSSTAFARWGHLHLLEHVASGSFGDVYRAWDQAIHREVALKLLKPRHDPDERDDTIEEGRRLAAVRHQHVVTVYGAARVDGRLGIWMEFIQGRTLSAVVQHDGPLSTDRVAALGATLCDAVTAVHAAGLIHRDIKAQNAMLADDGRLVLMDLGASRGEDDRSGDVAGTPLYLAPEVLAGWRATVQSDIYSIGVLLHFLCTGQFPVPAPATTLPLPLRPVIERALARDPRTRFTTAADLADTLRALCRPAKRRRPSPRFLLAAAALVLAAMAASAPLLRVAANSAYGSRGPSPDGGIVESTHRLPWPRTMPTGAPSIDGRYIGAVQWDVETPAGLPVVVDLLTDQIQRPWTPPREQLEAGGYAMSSTVSPDASRIAFTWYIPLAGGSTEIVVAPTGGGTARTILKESEAVVTELRVIGWSVDGSEVLVMRSLPSGRGDLRWVSLAGQVRHVLDLPGSQSASLNANGRDLVLDWPQQGAAGKRDLVLADMMTGQIRDLLREPANDTMPVWLPDGHRILFASDRGGTLGAWIIDVRESAEAVQVRGSMSYWQPFGFGARDELYYAAQTGTVDVYTAPIDLARRTIGDRVPLAISFAGRNLFSGWAPDSRHVAYTSRRGPVNFAPGSQVLVIRDVASDDERALATPFGDMAHPRWSPDGRQVAVAVMEHDGGIWLIGAESGALQHAWSGSDSTLVWALDWLSDDTLVFLSDSGQGSVLRQLALGTGAVTPLLSGALGFAVSHARDRLAWTVPVSDGVAVRVGNIERLNDAREIARLRPPSRLELAGWAPGDGGVVAVHSADGTREIAHVIDIPLDGGQPLTIGDAKLGRQARSMRLSPDGTRLSFEAGAPELTPWVLEHPLFQH